MLQHIVLLFVHFVSTICRSITYVTRWGEPGIRAWRHRELSVFALLVIKANQREDGEIRLPLVALERRPCKRQ